MLLDLFITNQYEMPVRENNGRRSAQTKISLEDGVILSFIENSRAYRAVYGNDYDKLTDRVALPLLAIDMI